MGGGQFAVVHCRTLCFSLRVEGKVKTKSPTPTPPEEVCVTLWSTFRSSSQIEAGTF